MSLGLVLIIVAIDWLLPAGVIFGVFLGVPLLLASTSQRTSDVWVVLMASMLGFLIAAIFGRPPVAPPAQWLPNRILALIVIPAAGILAAFMQQRRLEAEQTRDAALLAGSTNRLLFSLLAHDLRSPLVLSRQLLDYIEQCTVQGSAPDVTLLQDVRLRIDRNLRVIDGVLAAARAEISDGNGDAEQTARTLQLADEIADEASSFRAEAAMRNKEITLSLERATRTIVAREALVMRQVLGILLDNAIRYADPGTIAVQALVTNGVLLLNVRDPGSHNTPKAPEDGGAGLGLQLCSLLLSRAGGSLSVTAAEDDATTVVARLPLGG